MMTNALIYRRLKVGAANFLVHQCIEQPPSSFFPAGIEKRVPRWDKCLNVLGGYVEKKKLLFNAGFTYCLIWKLLFSNMPFVGPMHFLFAICENYALLHVISNWTELSIPCGVISSTDALWRHRYKIFKRCWKLNFLQNIYLGFIMSQKLRKRQRLATYIWYDPRIIGSVLHGRTA